jgi:peptide chain release factor 1
MEQKEQALRTELAELEERLSDPAIFSSKEYPKLAKRRSETERVVGLFDEKSQLAKAKAEAEELASGGDAEMAELARTELDELAEKTAANNAALQEALTPKDPNDDRDVVI